MRRDQPRQVIYRDQAPPQQAMMHGSNVQMYTMNHNGQMPQIRNTFPNSNRMQYGQNAQQFVPMMQNQDAIYNNQRYVHGNFAVNYNTQTQHYHQPMAYQQQQGYPRSVYINQPMNQQMVNNYNAIPQQQIHQSHPTAIQQQRPVLYASGQNNMMHHPKQQQQQQQPAQQNTESISSPAQTVHNTPKKRATITLKDPNTGKDLTSEILKKKAPTPTTTPKPQAPPVIKPPPVEPVSYDAKLQANAQFAAQVAALSKKDSELQENSNENTEVKKEKSESVLDEIKSDKLPEAADTQNKEEVKQVKSAVVEGVTEALEKNVINVTKDLTEENTPKNVLLSDPVTDTEKKLEQIEVKLIKKDNDQSKLVIEEVEVLSEPVTETKPSELSDAEDNNEDSKTLINGHEDVNKSNVNTVAKKKKKQRLKDLESKDNNSNDLLSAFTDVPQKEEHPIAEPVKNIEDKPVKETTWEDKEKTIDKEDIKREDAEPEVSPQQAPVTVVQTEGEVDATEEEKRQYDREFLLKFQFNPICTSKPPNLPDIDIVLDTPHQSTQPLDPSKRISNANDFMPQFMRQASGGRSSSGRKSQRGASTSGSKSHKIIQAQPQFEKLELKKSENAWVRPKELVKDLPEDVREKNELERNVRSILNKLTPQKFKTLVDQMTALKINSEEKLELAIALIFEKAISEPGFSVAYANMCRVLTEVFRAIPDTSGKQSNIFRKILLNKCQKEFEKDKSDEKQMEEDRTKTFENELERKAWIEELDYRELTTRRRTLGNIRFIGELFKLKMISEKIMHECILKLLRSSKQETMEEQLECLCKLLSTIGKDLDHQDAKPRMDQYFQQIQKIIEKKKISSRIRFALQDVQDLRNCGWVPRRDEGNPKTIDQIHREAQQKEKAAEIQRQQDKLKRSEPRRGGGGRDSPVVRPGASNGDGWTNVPMKTSRSFAPTPVDASKFKIKKNDSSEVSLGPGGRPGAWSRGASGGTNSRSGSGSNTPTSEIDQKTNRYDLLSDSSLTTTMTDAKKGPRQSNSLRKSSQNASSTGRRGFDDRSAALRAVKNMTGGSSRNQSPVRSGDSSRNSPSSGSQTPVDAVSPNPNSVDDEKMRKVTKSTAEEFFGLMDYKEAVMCIKELEAPKLHNVFIEELFVVATEKKIMERILTGKLITHVVKEELITMPQLVSGFNSVVELAPDLAVDIPLFYKYLGEILGPMIFEKVLTLTALKDLLSPLMQFNKVGLVIAEALNSAAEHVSNEEAVAEIWQESGLTWEQLLQKGCSEDDFVKDKKVEYTKVKGGSKQSHASKVQDELVQMLKAKTDNKNVMEFIDEKVPKNEISPEFIRQLTYTVCKSATRQEKEMECTCEKNVLSTRKNLLLRYIGGKKDFELQAAFALQQLVTDLDHPRGLLTAFFEELYDGDIITEETFYTWESSKEFPDGKGNARSDVKSFLTWLRKAEEESNEEDSTSTTSTGLPTSSN